MPTIASNTEKGSCESTEARAQGRHLRPDVGTETRAFNAPTVFSPNPTVTGNVTGSKHPSNPPFCSFVPQMSQSTAEHSETVGTSRHDPPRGAQSQRTDQQGLAWRRTLERTRSFPKKSQAVKDNTSTTLDATAATTYRRAHG